MDNSTLSAVSDVQQNKEDNKKKKIKEIEPGDTVFLMYNDNTSFEVGEKVEVVKPDNTHKHSSYDWFQIRGKNPFGRGYLKQNVPVTFLEQVTPESEAKYEEMKRQKEEANQEVIDEEEIIESKTEEVIEEELDEELTQETVETETIEEVAESA